MALALHNTADTAGHFLYPSGIPLAPEQASLSLVPLTALKNFPDPGHHVVHTDLT